MEHTEFALAIFDLNGNMLGLVSRILDGCKHCSTKPTPCHAHKKLIERVTAADQAMQDVAREVDRVIKGE